MFSSISLIGVGVYCLTIFLLCRAVGGLSTIVSQCCQLGGVVSPLYLSESLTNPRSVIVYTLLGSLSLSLLFSFSSSSSSSFFTVTILFLHIYLLILPFLSSILTSRSNLSSFLSSVLSFSTSSVSFYHFLHCHFAFL